MKPSDPFRPHELQLAKDTARLVTEMIVQMKLEDKAIIVSFDIRKVKAIKDLNDNITVGTLFTQKHSVIPKSRYLEMKELGDLQQCVQDAPNDTIQFFQFVLQSGLLFKQSGSSSFDCDIKLYNNPAYSNNTIDTLRKNYGAEISTGFYTMFSMGKSEGENSRDAEKAKLLIESGGGQRFITDDVERARNFLGRSSSTGRKFGYSATLLIFNLFVLLFLTF